MAFLVHHSISILNIIDTHRNYIQYYIYNCHRIQHLYTHIFLEIYLELQFIRMDYDFQCTRIMILRIDMMLQSIL